MGNEKATTFLNETFTLICPCHFGLESVLKREIQELGYEISLVEDGKVSYVPIEQQRKLTGIHIFDVYVEYLAQCNSDINAFVDRYGLKVTDIDSLVFVLTGMRGVDFRQKYQVQIADDLLRYTDLTIAEVAKRSGIGSANNLYLTFKREFNLAPGYRRLRIRQEGDLGRYKL